MSNYFFEHTFVKSGGAEIYTVSVRPDKDGKYPVVVMRSPYVNDMCGYTPEECAALKAEKFAEYPEHGYILVYQHCRGYGLSTGEARPFINEREDGLNLLKWIREQSFYNGEIFLEGGSYLADVHYAVSPYADDIKGVSLWIMTSEVYELFYRNGVMKSGNVFGWYAEMYKQRELTGKKTFTYDAFKMLPFEDFDITAFGERDECFGKVTKATEPDDKFWTEDTPKYYSNAVKNPKIPVLLSGGFYDVAGGAMIRMWRDMAPETKAMSAFVMSPNDHGDGHSENSIDFPDSVRAEHFGADYNFRWYDAIRGKGEYPFERGKVTYYSIFDNEWYTDDFEPYDDTRREITLSGGTKTYVYNPFAPARFNGGLSCSFEGTEFMAPPNSRYDIITTYTPEFDKDTHLKGAMKLKLVVSSDREDTCFVARVGVTTEDGKDFALRDDIRTLVRELGDYKPGEKVELNFEFDEHALKIGAGMKLRIDISSSDSAHYIPHTNAKGPFAEQRTAFVAHNTVYLDESVLSIPVK